MLISTDWGVILNPASLQFPMLPLNLFKFLSGRRGGHPILHSVNFLISQEIRHRKKMSICVSNHVIFGPTANRRKMFSDFVWQLSHTTPNELKPLHIPAFLSLALSFFFSFFKLDLHSENVLKTYLFMIFRWRAIMKKKKDCGSELKLLITGERNKPFEIKVSLYLRFT